MSKFQEVKKLLQRDELKIALNLILKITTDDKRVRHLDFVQNIILHFSNL